MSRKAAGARLCRSRDARALDPRTRRTRLSRTSVSLLDAGGRWRRQRRSDRSRLQCRAAMGRRAVCGRLSHRKCSRLICSRALGLESRSGGSARRLVHAFAQRKTTGRVASRIGGMSTDRAEQNRAKDRPKIPGDFPAAPLTLEGYSILHQMFRVRRANGARSISETQTPSRRKRRRCSARWRKREDGESACFSQLGHKGDLMLVHFRRSFEELNQAEIAIAESRSWPTTSNRRRRICR